MWMLHSPWALLLLAVPAAYLWMQGRRKVHYGFSLGSALVQAPASARVRLKRALPALWAAGMVLLCVALARPRSGVTYEEYLTRGVDIMLTLDCSGSMMSEDFKPDNRLAVAKAVVKDFVQSRPSDRLGLVTYERPRQPMFMPENFTQNKTYSETKATEIDEEISRMITEAHERVQKILGERRKVLDDLAHLLSQKEIVQGDELRKLLSESAAETAVASA